MQDYVIIKGQIKLIENATAPTGTKPEEWNQLDRITRVTIRLYFLESIYYIAQLCATAHKLWETLLSTYEEKETATKIYLTDALQSIDEGSQFGHDPH